jgi:hypothetical protein
MSDFGLCTQRRSVVNHASLHAAICGGGAETRERIAGVGESRECDVDRIAQIRKPSLALACNASRNTLRDCLSSAVCAMGAVFGSRVSSVLMWIPNSCWSGRFCDWGEIVLVDCSGRASTTGGEDLPPLAQPQGSSRSSKEISLKQHVRAGFGVKRSTPYAFCGPKASYNSWTKERAYEVRYCHNGYRRTTVPRSETRAVSQRLGSYYYASASVA